MESQEIRFKQLCNVLEPKKQFSLLDYGCGYGALLNYVERFAANFTYTGFDISKQMITEAAQKNSG